MSRLPAPQDHLGDGVLTFYQSGGGMQVEIRPMRDEDLREVNRIIDEADSGATYLRRPAGFVAMNLRRVVGFTTNNVLLVLPWLRGRGIEEKLARRLDPTWKKPKY